MKRGFAVLALQILFILFHRKVHPIWPLKRPRSGARVRQAGLFIL